LRQNHACDDQYAQNGRQYLHVALAVFSKHIAARIAYMRDFKKRRSSRGEILHFVLRFVAAFVLLLVTLAAMQAAWDMYGRLSRASGGQADAEAQLKEMKAQEAAVSKSVAELSSARGQEALLREHYGVVRPGEGVVQIVHQAPTSTAATTTGGWFGQLFHTLFSW
jgi:cell division protein FtsB